MITYNEDEIKKLLAEYNPNNFEKYREITKQVFNENTSTCGCNAKRLYNKLKTHFKI